MALREACLASVLVLVALPALAQRSPPDQTDPDRAPNTPEDAFDGAAAFDELLLRDPDAAWAVYKLQQESGAQAAAHSLIQGASNAPTYLTLEERLTLDADWRRLSDVQKEAIDILAARDFETSVDAGVRRDMIREARGYYAALPALEREAMIERRRTVYENMTPTERAQWRYNSGDAYLALIEPQKDIFRARAFQTFQMMSRSDQSSLMSRAGRLLQERREARQAFLTQSTTRAISEDAVEEFDPITSQQQLLEFDQLSPEQQREYLDTLRDREDGQ